MGTIARPRVAMPADPGPPALGAGDDAADQTASAHGVELQSMPSRNVQTRTSSANDDVQLQFETLSKETEFGRMEP